MKTNHKIQSFTLSEMLVVLVITAIIVGLAFSVLNLVQKHMFSIQQNFNHNTELNSLEQALVIDFNRYENIEYNALDQQLIFKSEMDTLTYVFNKNYIKTERDSFPVILESKAFYFNGEAIEKGYIDAVKLRTDSTLQNQQLFIFKQNAANSFMH